MKKQPLQGAHPSMDFTTYSTVTLTLMGFRGMHIRACPWKDWCSTLWVTRAELAPHHQNFRNTGILFRSCFREYAFLILPASSPCTIALPECFALFLGIIELVSPLQEFLAQVLEAFRILRIIGQVVLLPWIRLQVEELGRSRALHPILDQLMAFVSDAPLKLLVGEEKGISEHVVWVV